MRIGAAAIGVFASILLNGSVNAAGIVPGDFMYCNGIVDSWERLACYDKAAAAGADLSLQAREADLARREAELKTRESGLKSADMGSVENQVAYFGVADPAARATNSNPEARNIAVAKTTTEKDESGRVEAIVAGIRELSIGPGGLAMIVLENGQVWRQVAAGDIPPFRSNEPNVARISKASFGSFLMSINGSNRQLRVRRVDGAGGK